MKKDYKNELLTLSEIETLIDELRTKKDDEFRYEKAHHIIATQIALLPRSKRKEVTIKIINHSNCYTYNYTYKSYDICDLYLNPSVDFSVNKKRCKYMTIEDILKHIDRLLSNPFDYKLGHTKRFIDGKHILDKKQSWITEIQKMNNQITECENWIKRYESYIDECNKEINILMK